MSEIKTYVDRIFDELVAIRRDIHAHPEVGMQEVRTSALIRRELEKMGMDEIQQPLPTAVVGLLHGGKGTRQVRGAPAPISTPCPSTRSPACPLPARRRASCTPAATTCTPPCCWARPRPCAICGTPLRVR